MHDDLSWLTVVAMVMWWRDAELNGVRERIPQGELMDGAASLRGPPAVEAASSQSISATWVPVRDPGDRSALALTNHNNNAFASVVLLSSGIFLWSGSVLSCPAPSSPYLSV